MDHNRITEDPLGVSDTVPTFSAAGREQPVGPIREDNELPVDDTLWADPAPPADRPTQPCYQGGAPYPPVTPPVQQSYPAAPPYQPPVNGQRQQGANGTGRTTNQKSVIVLLSVLVVLVLAVGGLIAYFILKPPKTPETTSADQTQSATEENTAAADAADAVSFSRWDNDQYTYIGDTDASVGIQITAADGTLSRVGISLYSATGNKLAEFDYMPTAEGNTKFFFKMNDEVGYTLSPETTYQYQCYAIVGGFKYFSDMYSFTTLPSRKGADKETAGAVSTQPATEEATPSSNAPNVVSFRQWNDTEYTYIGADDASLGVQITVADGTLSHVGIELYDGSDEKLADYDYVPETENTKFYFEMNDEVGYILSPATTYRYRFYGVIGEIMYFSPMYSFTTTDGEE